MNQGQPITCSSDLRNIMKKNRKDMVKRIENAENKRFFSVSFSSHQYRSLTSFFGVVGFFFTGCVFLVSTTNTQIMYVFQHSVYFSRNERSLDLSTIIRYVLAVCLFASLHFYFPRFFSFCCSQKIEEGSANKRVAGTGCYLSASASNSIVIVTCDVSGWCHRECILC